MIPTNRVKEFRQAQGLSGLELARRARIAPSALHNIENYKTVVYPGWKKRIARALGMSVGEIFPQEVPEENASASKR